MRLLVRSAAMLAVAATPVAQQVRTIDEGWFTLRVNGETVGRENFIIKHSPVAGGMNLVATAKITVSGRQLAPALTADTAGRPISYSLEIKFNNQVETSLRATAVGGRLLQQVRTPSGQSERELRLAPGTVILDQDVVHQYYFISRAPRGAWVPVLTPRTLVRDSVRVTVRGEGPVELRNGTVPATHLIVTNAAGVATDLWVDAAGRVLRVAIPARHFEAERDEAPR